ncbi:hypothetical protein [Pseudarthrobacter sp. AB1]|uniref:hypothetical protein n=1 Tax=Pseudarthrobacter sp. AB1 TaxID=2138309 RepID=UPI00186B8B55|nr:hypothetical protein [Pseudarthrobacter sp. AB1]MBE4716630.1 hypothetical protein [Pseudarthrobacter sp. AB1]
MASTSQLPEPPPHGDRAAGHRVGAAVAVDVGGGGAICGPIIRGAVARLAFGWQVNFYMFAIFAVVGGVVVFTVPEKIHP